PLRRRDRRLHFPVAVRGRYRRRRSERAGRRPQGPGAGWSGHSRARRRARTMNVADFRKLGKQALACALVFGIWCAPIPAGLTREAWHLFAVFAAAIFAVIVNAFPLLTASLLAVGAVVLTGTVDPAKAFAGFANSSVLLVVV